VPTGGEEGGTEMPEETSPTEGLTVVWRVEPQRDTSEIKRFWSKVVCGPASTDCWLWVGAIADDGYGRFWIRRQGNTRVVRPHRYALALVTDGGDLDEVEVAEHQVCDVPICVRAEPGGVGHVVASTQAENLARMGWKGRGGGARWQQRFRGVDRAQRAAASRALRAAVCHGWDAHQIDMLAATQQETLW
jgi:hypothetical protein